MFGHTSSVPNAPCGVESYRQQHTDEDDNYVPNAPCGVESENSEIGRPDRNHSS
jgi:hypothetical protein